jgi:hypothetical protein
MASMKKTDRQTVLVRLEKQEPSDPTGGLQTSAATLEPWSLLQA